MRYPILNYLNTFINIYNINEIVNLYQLANFRKDDII